MSVIVFGANGQLGRALQKILPNAIFYTQKTVDVTDFSRVTEVCSALEKVDSIINTAAYTNVDGAETNTQLARLINAKAVENIATIANIFKATLVHISTDYVFDGNSTKQYKPMDSPNPINAYGQTKLEGEIAASQTKKQYIVRTSWVYGDGNNFVKTMLRLGNERKVVEVVSDQIGVPTSADDLARFCDFLIKTHPPYGTYHFCNSGDGISWADFAEAIFAIAEIDCVVKPVSTEEYMKNNPQIIATRPRHSVLDCSKNILDPIHDKKNFYARGWYAALYDYIKNDCSII